MYGHNFTSFPDGYPCPSASKWRIHLYPTDFRGGLYQILNFLMYLCLYLDCLFYFTSLFMHQYFTVLIIQTLWTILKSVNTGAPHCFDTVFLAILFIYLFHDSFRTHLIGLWITLNLQVNLNWRLDNVDHSCLIICLSIYSSCLCIFFFTKIKFLLILKCFFFFFSLKILFSSIISSNKLLAYCRI